MSHQEVPNVSKLPLNAIWLSLLNEQSAVLVVAIGAPSSRMAGGADLRLSRGRHAMTFKPSGIVSQKRLRKQLS
jgi:hypothetical protein